MGSHYVKEIISSYGKGEASFYFNKDFELYKRITAYHKNNYFYRYIFTFDSNSEVLREFYEVRGLSESKLSLARKTIKILYEYYRDK